MNLTEALARLKAAECPEDIFAGDLKHNFREWAKIVHPDGKRGKALEQATEAFKLLNAWQEKAKDKIVAGTFGDRTALSPIFLATKTARYTLNKRTTGGSLCSVYCGTDARSHTVIVKLVRSPANNDLMVNEQEKLKYLWTEARTKDLKAMCHIPKLVDSFTLAKGPQRRQVNVLQCLEGYISVADIIAAYPEGIDLRDSAWMFNRLLGALLIVQQADLVHGAVLPEHIMVHPENHNGVLIDWCYCVRRKQTVKAIVEQHWDLYPPEILNKHPVTIATDLYMAAKVMLRLTSKATLSRETAGLLKACTLSQSNRPQEVYGLFKEFGAALKAAVGERKYRLFQMPSKK